MTIVAKINLPLHKNVLGKTRFYMSNFPLKKLKKQKKRCNERKHTSKSEISLFLAFGIARPGGILSIQ